MSSSEGGFQVSEVEAVKQLVALIREYGSLPRAIFGLISLYLLNGILDVVGIVVGSILFAFDLVVASLATAQGLLIRAFGAVGIDVLGALVGLQRAIGGVVEAAGPAGPPLAVAFGAVSLYVLWRIGIALLGELPGGSSIVDLLGLR